MLKLGLFYKLIGNPLETNSSQGGIEAAPSDLDLPNIPEFQNLPDNIFVQVNQPINDDDNAEIWGFELSAERQFTFLPGIWDGFGVFANYTYTDSSRTRRFSTSAVPEGFVEIDGPFDSSAPHTGTFAFTYSKFDIDASLAYTYQDRRLASNARFGLDRYFDEYDSLDFSVAYFSDVGPATVRFYFEGADLLRDSTEPSVGQSFGGANGTPRYDGGERRYFGGRSFVFGLAATF